MDLKPDGLSPDIAWYLESDLYSRGTDHYGRMYPRTLAKRLEPDPEDDPADHWASQENRRQR